MMAVPFGALELRVPKWSFFAIKDSIMSYLKELVERVVRDLSMGTEEKPTITYSHPNSEGYVEILLRDESGMTVGFGVDPLESEVEILYEMAYRIPTVYVELYSVGLPLVPGTERPAAPRIKEESVLWVDPSESGTWSCLVGEYGKIPGERVPISRGQ
ncbi:hypothetical protein ACIA8I_09185 [Streptomyces rishiriensis]|uniref:hypothetical protein n=1 Tax=Streptomyces rishiriensis TaxID=68264 RepID=UPI003788296B